MSTYLIYKNKVANTKKIGTYQNIKVAAQLFLNWIIWNKRH